MKKIIVFICIFLSVMTLHARAIQEDYRRAEENARISYAFGMIIGANFDLGSLGIQFDYAALAQGIKSSIDSSAAPQFSEHEAMEIVETAIQRAIDRISSENQRLEEEFLHTNRQRPEVQVTDSGLQYEVIVDRDGEKPESNSVVRVNYKGTFIDGSPFDSSMEETGAYIPLELVIPGWAEGLMLMSPGSIYRFFIPSNLAYGRAGFDGFIPPYSTLILNVELLEIINQDEGFGF